MPIRILIADDHRLVREGLAGILEDESDCEVIGQAADGLEAVDLTERLAPDVVIMDVNMPNLGGVQATERITALWPQVRVIGLSMHTSDIGGPKMHAAGAVAYVCKSAAMTELVAAIRAAVSG